MTLLDAVVVGFAGVVVGGGWVAVGRIRHLILEPDSGERRNRYALWLAWLGVTAVSLAALFGTLHRVARWTDAEALATAGLFVACGALGAVFARA
ncbi:hypothetical protein, partial [Roseateles sp.]|uniref:hypothetical protein n=1 Tax=Roseateles sp. TaxID=1971397 RepID=UPI003BA6FEAB